MLIIIVIIIMERNSVENAINNYHVNRRIIDELSNKNNDNYYKLIFNGK